MRLRWIIPIAILLPLHLDSAEQAVSARVATVTIDPRDVTALHLRSEFESTIRMPEEVTSVILGSPGSFKAEHNEGEPEYVYVKPITKEPAQSNLLIATKSGQHVTLELISDGASTSATEPVDFLIEYRASRSFLINSDAPLTISPKVSYKGRGSGSDDELTRPQSALSLEFEEQKRINAPDWKKWDGKQIETSIGDVRQLANETVISYSVFNNSDEPVEIVPPQIQIMGRKSEKKKKKEGKGIISDQLEVRDYKLSTTRLEAGRTILDKDEMGNRKSTAKTDQEAGTGGGPSSSATRVLLLVHLWSGDSAAGLPPPPLAVAMVEDLLSASLCELKKGIASPVGSVFQTSHTPSTRHGGLHASYGHSVEPQKRALWTAA